MDMISRIFLPIEFLIFKQQIKIIFNIKHFKIKMKFIKNNKNKLIKVMINNKNNIKIIVFNNNIKISEKDLKQIIFNKAKKPNIS